MADVETTQLGYWQMLMPKWQVEKPHWWMADVAAIVADEMATYDGMVYKFR